MKGTEKQIKWASEILGNINKTFDTYKSLCPANCPTKAVADAQIAQISAKQSLLNAEDAYAGDIIDLFKGIRFTGDWRKDFPEVLSVYRVSNPSTVTAKQLLGR